MHHNECQVTDPELRCEIAKAIRRAPYSPAKSPAKIYFTPWVGPHYGHKAGPLDGSRLLILGASHYEWCEACRTSGRRWPQYLTCWCVAELVVRPGHHAQHWRKIENALIGSDATPDERTALWNSVAYANLVQRIVGSGPRVAPTAEMWAEGRAVFPALLEALRPTFVVVLGKQVWQCLTVEEIQGEPLVSVKAEGKEVLRWRYTLTQQAHVIVCRVLHPAAGLGGTWHSAITKALTG